MIPNPANTDGHLELTPHFPRHHLDGRISSMLHILVSLSSMRNLSAGSWIGFEAVTYAHSSSCTQNLLAPTVWNEAGSLQ